MFNAALSRVRLFWILQIGGWLALVFLYIIINLIAGVPENMAILNGVYRQVVGFLLTLILWRIYRRWSRGSESLFRNALAAAGLSLVATALDHAAFVLFYTALKVNLNQTMPSLVVLAATTLRLAIYFGWSLCCLSARHLLHTQDQSLKIARAETAAREAELQMLRSQLNPHFLFNALNSIVAEADDNPSGVKTITRGLSEFLRFSLRQRGHFGVFGEELVAIENYLHVERSRFEERLNWHIAVTPALRAARVPCALLLPLVENAIKFGLQTSPQALEIRVRADCRDRMLIAVVENTGHWIELDAGNARATHIGLANLRRRLELLYGPRAHVAISSPPGWVRMEVHVPVDPVVRP